MEKLAYFKPDKTWQSWGWYDYEDYQEKMVIQGRFHDGVPEDIKEDYKTVEYLMAHAFYHYRMYDDALNHLLGTFEMAVKFRAKHLEISMEHPPNKKGKVFKKSLGELIEEVSDTEWTDNWRFFMNRVRVLRNNMKHPERHTIMGYFAKQNIIPILNFFNKLFLPSELKESTANEIERINNQLEGFKERVFVVPNDEKTNYLGYAPHVTDCYQKNDKWFYMLHFMPVLNNVGEMIQNNQYGRHSPHLYIVDIKTDKDSIKKIMLLEFDQVLDMTTENLKKENIHTFNCFMSELKEQKSEDVDMFYHWLKTELFSKREKLLYESAWS